MTLLPSPVDLVGVSSAGRVPVLCYPLGPGTCLLRRATRRRLRPLRQAAHPRAPGRRPFARRPVLEDDRALEVAHVNLVHRRPARRLPDHPPRIASRLSSGSPQGRRDGPARAVLRRPARQTTMASSLVGGLGADACYVARQTAARRPPPAARRTWPALGHDTATPAGTDAGGQARRAGSGQAGAPGPAYQPPGRYWSSCWTQTPGPTEALHAELGVDRSAARQRLGLPRAPCPGSRSGSDL